MMSLLSLPCNYLVVNQSLQLQLFVVVMLGQIFVQEVSGADDKVHFLILGFFILTHQAIIVSRLHPYFEDMNLRKKENMETVFMLLSLLLLLH